MEPMILYTEETPILCGLQSKFKPAWYFMYKYVQAGWLISPSIFIHRDYKMLSRLHLWNWSYIFWSVLGWMSPPQI
jgi:hypothetical protein